MSQQLFLNILFKDYYHEDKTNSYTDIHIILLVRILNPTDDIYPPQRPRPNKPPPTMFTQTLDPGATIIL